MKNQNNTSANNNGLMWLKIDGYKSNINQAKSSGYDNLMWLLVKGYQHNKTESPAQSGGKSFSSVDAFFRTLFLL